MSHSWGPPQEGLYPNRRWWGKVWQKRKIQSVSNLWQKQMGNRVDEEYINAKCSEKVKLMHLKRWKKGREKQENKIGSLTLIQETSKKNKTIINTEKPYGNKWENEIPRAYEKVYDLHFWPWESTFLLPTTRKKKFKVNRKALFLDLTQ